MQRLTPAKRIWLLFFLITSAAYLYGLGNFPFIGPDEPRYAEVAREMFERGDMVTPTLGGHTWFEKPVLSYWTMMVGYGLFGASEWSARLGFALMGLLTVLVVYWIGSRTEKAGSNENDLSLLALSSGVAIASSGGLIIFSHGVNFDVPLTLTTTLALACFFVSELEEEKSRRIGLLCGFYIFMGATLLAKGLVGLVIIFGIVTAYYVLRRAWPRKAILLSPLWGVPLALLVAALWYAPVIARHGWAFVDEFIIQHHFARYTSNKYHHPQPFYFYIPVILLFALPWTLYLFESLASARHWSWRASDALSKWRVFALAWLVVPVLFFSASGSKLPGYVLPALPGAAMLIGERLARMIRGESGLLMLRATGASLALLGLISIIFIESKGYSIETCVVMGAMPMVAGGLLALLLAKRRWVASGAIACAIFFMIMVWLGCGIENISRRLSTGYAFEQAAARGYGTAPVYQFNVRERTAEYYAAGRLQYGPDGEPLKFEGAMQVEAAARAHGGTVLVIVPSQFKNLLTDYPPLETEVIEDNGGVALVAVRIRK